MLPQPRLRFLLADEPGTGKTLMTGMYLAEGRRLGLIPGKTVIVVPAHLVTKWINELRRFFGIEAHRITAEIGRDPLNLRDDVDVWVVSLDLYTYNGDVRRKIVGGAASWSLAVFDEAHRLTPTSQYLGAARQLADVTHHLLLLTATPHRGKEHFFRALLNLLDPALYPWDESTKDYGGQVLRPGRDNFLRRMKEDLKDLDGNDLFKARMAETRHVHLTAPEQDAYEAVMGYVDAWYPAESHLARSIYGKRAASSIAAAAQTLRRRAAALTAAKPGAVDPVLPTGFDRDDLSGADIDSDEAWSQAEYAVLHSRSRDRRAEIDAVKKVIARLDRLMARDDPPAKWQATSEIMAQHGIAPGKGQLLVFTEFADTARWLVERFRAAGYTAEVLDGDVDHDGRQVLQARFLAEDFQILVSTDAGGEGIDLQSAHVMVDWDIPWSLVRLEQRAGRLHRIGQKNDVYIYHLVASQTREGRVQQVMLDNLTAASRALGGRIYDLLDATFDRTGFSYAAAMAAAHRNPDAVGTTLHSVPDTETLVARAKEMVAEEERLKTPVDPREAMARLIEDRLHTINPVIVSAYLDQVASVQGWEIVNGPAPGIRILRDPNRGLPEAFGSRSECLVAADAATVARAHAEQFRRASDVIVLGPTEEPFQQLVAVAARRCDADLLAGAAAIDLASFSDYTLFVYAADIEEHDGLRRVRRTVPFLVRYSGAGAFTVAWESVMNLVPTATAAARPSPAARLSAEQHVRAQVEAEVGQIVANKRALTARMRMDIDDIERRLKRQLRDQPPEVRRTTMARFGQTKAERLAHFDQLEHVTHGPPRLLGWLSVTGGARDVELGHDPDSEKVAIATVADELRQHGWDVDDRQTAGLGYDLFARRRGTTQQRLIEVKGFTGSLRAVVLEQHEWAQAQQRGSDYWLYVVEHCATRPRVVIRCQDPATTFAGSPKLIQRFKISAAALRRLVEPE
jgi:superfamily II DNA or RNA helicase